MKEYVLLFGECDPWHLSCSEEAAEWIKTVLYYLDENCGNCLDYPALLTKEDYENGNRQE